MRIFSARITMVNIRYTIEPQNSSEIFGALEDTRTILKTNPTFNSFAVASYHLNPHTPWSSLQISKSLLPLIQAHPEYVSELIRHLKPIEKNSIGGLNVKVGMEEEHTDLRVISVVYTLIEMYPHHRNWSIITAQILNLMDHHLVAVKVMACELLQKAVDKGIDFKSTGLTELFMDNLKIYLSLVNNEGEEVDQLIRISFALFLSLKSEFDGLVDLLGTMVLSLDKKFNRNGESHHLKVVLQMLFELTNILGPQILVGLNRLNFILNQMITSPYLLETSPLTVQKVLELQYTILSAFDEAETEAKQLVFEYRFDLLAAWSVLSRRSETNVSKQMEKLGEISRELNCELEII